MARKSIATTAKADREIEVKQKGGRHRLPATPEQPFNATPELAEANAALNEVARLESAVSEDQVIFSSEIGEMIGRRRLGKAMQTLVTVTDLLQYQRMKESKAYRYKKVIVLDNDGQAKSVTLTTWAEFCRHVDGRSVDQVDEDIANLKACGGALMEALQVMGLGYRDMRRLRASVTDDRRPELLELAKAGDKDALLDAVAVFAEERTLEATKLAAKLKDTQQELQASRANTAKLHEKVDHLQEKIDRPYVPTPGAIAQSASEAATLTEMCEAFNSTHLQMLRVATIVSDVFDHHTEVEPISAFAGACLRHLVRSLASLAVTHDINVNEDIDAAAVAPWITARLSAESIAKLEEQARSDGPPSKLPKRKKVY